MLTPTQLAEIRGRSWRLKCDDCGSLFNERHQGEPCPLRLCSSCKGTLQFHDVTALLMHIDYLAEAGVARDFELLAAQKQVEALNAQVEKLKALLKEAHTQIDNDHGGLPEGSCPTCQLLDRIEEALK